MTLTNFRAEDFEGRGDNVKVARSKRDRMAVPEPTSKPILAADASPEDVPSGTVAEVLTWVGDDPVRAQKALDAEVSHDKPRKGLVSVLTEKIDAEAEAKPEESDDDEK